MKPAETEDWNQLVQRAIGQLEQYNSLQNLLSYVVEPAFENWERLYVSDVKGKCSWTYVVWKRKEDSQRRQVSKSQREAVVLDQRIPTIEKFTGEMPDGFLERLLPMIEGLQIKPYIPRTIFGLDATNYSIGLGSFWHNSRFSWWRQLPDDWAVLQPLNDLLQAILEDARAQSAV